MKKKKTVLFLALLLMVFISWTSSGEKEYQQKWSKVGILPVRDLYSAHWCGYSSIVYFHVLSQHESDIKGGIRLYDVKKGKREWISKDSNSGLGFCSTDGSVAFWYSKDGLMAYDTRVGRKWRTEIDLAKLKASIRSSPVNNTLLVAGVDRDEVANLLSKNLQGWKILKEPLNPSQMCGESSWSRDGTYFHIREKINRGKCRLAIYDANGKLQRYVDNSPVRAEELIVSGSYYFLDRLDYLIKKIDIKTGETNSYPVPKGIQGFDINSKGELIYWISPSKGPNIWFANKIEDNPYLLEYEGGAPRFSPGGEYLYFHANNEGIVVLKRK